MTLQKPLYWDEAKAHLSDNDAVLANIIKNYSGQEGLQDRGNAFETLCRAVVGQQISVKAAQSVWAKFAGLGDVVPEKVMVLAEEDLRGVGLSRQKVKYVHGIARGFAEGVVHPAQWKNWDDEAIITELVKLPGIGRWTAEMFLMFHLLRPDVLPVGDLGLVKGFERHYGQDKGQLSVHAEVWRPYRSVATWYLWRSLEGPAAI